MINIDNVYDTFRKARALKAAITVIALLVLFILPATSSYAEEKDPTGRDIVRQCGYKYPGKDQKSTFTVILTDKQGNQKKSVYSRWWKDYQGAKGVIDKMILFTEFPPDAKGAAFMRIAYTPDMGKNADQWIYLPVLAKTRRVTIRDPGDSFLNSDLTHADVSYHALDEEDHHLLGVRNSQGVDYYVIESTPKEGGARLYKKRVLWFTKTPNWDECVNVRIDYYDGRGDLQKEQHTEWQRVKDAWVWHKVLVRNIQTSHTSEFVISDVVIDTGIEDRFFAERTLKAGPDSAPIAK